MARSTNRAAAWMESCLWAVGCLALGYCAFLWGRAEFDQAQGNWTLDHQAGSHAAPSAISEGSLLGRIEVPRLDLSAVVFEGTSDDTLSRGVGHLRGSAAPGQHGNLVLAGHRDTFFRGLRGIRQGDQVTVQAPNGEFRYQVQSTFIVQPDDTEVLQPSTDATLTLITCFPFGYIGNAPERFIVRATKIAKARDSS
jgi:sortase A